jgi:CRP/FNR family transcriptional regulator, cyclic AMP receptor protein
MEESAYLKDRHDLVDIVKKIPFLNSYDEKYLVNILNFSKLRKYNAGEVIAKENEFDSWFYIILSGEVMVIKHGTEIARLDSQGGTFGEMAVIEGTPRSASIVAIKDTNCLAIDGAFLGRLAPEDRPKFEAVYYRILSEELAHRLRATSEELSLLKKKLGKED